MKLSELTAAVAAMSTSYYRLLFVTGPDPAVRDSLLHAFAAHAPAPILNVSTILAESLLPFPRRDRIGQVGPILDGAVTSLEANVVCLDNIEVLFIPELRVDVLQRFQQLSRNRTVVVNWPGAWSSGTLTYADAAHPEFFQAPVDDISVFRAAGPGQFPV